MKKLIKNVLTLCLSFLSIIVFAQKPKIAPDPNVTVSSPMPCNPSNSLNISTGINSSGGLIPIGTTDPFWTTGTAIAPLTGGMAAWNVIANTRILSPTANDKEVGTYTLRRKFYLCEKAEVTFKGMLRCDNTLTSFRIYDSNGVVAHDFNLSSNDPSCWKDILFSTTVGLPAGENYLEVVYNNSGSWGGFALFGNLSSQKSTLANFKNCCCDCSLLPIKPVIDGQESLCKAKECNDILQYSVQLPNAIKNCVSYYWSISSNVQFSGQGTGQISINCKSLKAGQTYTINLTIKCGNKTVQTSINLVVCEKLSPDFKVTTNGSSVDVQGSPGGFHYWSLSKDNNNNCDYEYPETSTNSGWVGPIFTFNSLVTGQQYVLYHAVINICSKNVYCITTKKICFKWFAAEMKTDGKSSFSLEKISEEIVEESKVPDFILKEVKTIK